MCKSVQKNFKMKRNVWAICYWSSNAMLFTHWRSDWNFFSTRFLKLYCNFHCWKILLILVLGKVASKTQYSHFVICKVGVLGFTHHFTLHPLIWQIFSLISWLYFSTMWILWGRKCDYWVFHITHAKKGLPNHSSSTRDLKDFFSICDVENTILTYPPHSILSFLNHNQECF